MAAEQTRKILENIGTITPCNVVPNSPTPRKDPTLPAAQNSPRIPPLVQVGYLSDVVMRVPHILAISMFKRV